MQFISLNYLLFLGGAVLLHTLVQRWGHRWRSLVLAAISIFFYLLLPNGALQWQYLPLLVLLTGINYGIGLAIALPQQGPPPLAQEWHRPGRVWMALGIALNVLLLLGFKYIPFFLDTFAGIWPGLAAIGEAWRDRLLPPLGISFFTFECIAYLVDTYRGAPACTQPIAFLSYKFFFPKLISGPITRFHSFQQQQETSALPDRAQIIEALWLIATGAVKKALLADHLGILVDLCVGNLERAGSGDLWLVVVAYGLQLYLDFSGYVDMARGSAKLLGFHLPENFDFPYFSSNLADFWRRWHMTLGDWLRNYLYFPLGGSRRGLGRTCLNLMIVMVIAGLWHGAAWGFVIWGLLHGFGLVLHRLCHALGERWLWWAKLWRSLPGIVAAWAITQGGVFLAWIPFRINDWQQLQWIAQNFFNHPADVQFGVKVYGEALQMGRIYIVVLLALIWLGMAIACVVQRQWRLHLHWPVKVALIPLLLYGVGLFAPQGGLPYIYFDF